MKAFNAILAALSPLLVFAITIQEVPQCAQNCLANSTQSQTRCQVINIACLCQDPAYVSALSCCLATQCNSDEQATAIEFNQQECANVNESAPNFVGCAPSNLASSTFLASSTASSTFSTSTVLVSTVSGTVVSEPATFSGSRFTASFDGRPLLTGICTQPYFALITRGPDMATQFPQVGCSPDRPDCCLFPYEADGVITRCPQDHFTTAGACCPLGYQVYYTNIGAQTQCYSMPSSTIVPTTIPTASGLTLITDHVFAQRYVLGTASSTQGLSEGALAGIGVGAAVVFISLIGALWFWRYRKIKQIREPKEVTTFPATDPTIPMSEASQLPQSPQELASPEQQRMSSRSPRLNIWPMGGPLSSPPAYEGGRVRSDSSKGIPQELPGSTYIHEHYPALNKNDPPLPTSPSTPKTPTRSLTGGSGSGSPMVTPSSSAPGFGPRSPPIVSPLSSPKLPPNRKN